jgi:hypothetical protein
MNPGQPSRRHKYVMPNKTQRRPRVLTFSTPFKRRRIKSSEISLQPSEKPLKPGTRRPLGDKLQELALVRPTAMIVIETLVDRFLWKIVNRGSANDEHP